MRLDASAAEPNYVVRFFKDRNTNKAWVQDMQGNKVPLSQQPIVEGNLTLVPVDKVLMSGECGTPRRAVLCCALLALQCSFNTCAAVGFQRFLRCAC
jgi:hypothetical protein